MSRIAVAGAGSWGTALAVMLGRRGHSVRLWTRRQDLARELAALRSNTAYLPGVELPAEVEVTADPRVAMEGADVAVCALPSAHVRETLGLFADAAAPGTCWVSATKGLEVETQLRVSQVIQESLHSPVPIVVLSGPSFAVEAVRGDPTAVVAASSEAGAAAAVQEVFASRRFRVYTNSDVVGTEIGGAVKNVIALAAGVVAGLGFGSNTVAGLITRGLAEICRLAVALGGQRETLAGLSGLGDLVLTCTGPLSRNRRAGMQLAQGWSLARVRTFSPMVVEGIPTTDATFRLAHRYGVEMPITDQMHKVLHAGKPPEQAVADLMDRRLREES